MASLPKKSSPTTDIPTETNPGRGVGGQPDILAQPPPSKQPAPLLRDNPNLTRADSNAGPCPTQNDNDQPGDDSADTSADNGSDFASAPWVAFLSSPPQRSISDGSATSSPSPSERAFRDDTTSEWLENHTSSGGPWSPPAAPHSQRASDSPTFDGGLLGQGPAADEALNNR